MIRINLLPFRADRKKENVRRQVSLFLLSLALVLIIAFYYNFSLGSKISRFNKKIKNTNAELTKYNEINKEIARIRQNLENLRKKMAVIEQLESDRHAPVVLMDTITQVLVAKRMWLTELAVQEKTVRITGIALDEKTVADFMVRLQKSGLFSNVELKTVRRQEVQKTNLKSFQIVCTKVPPQKPQSANKRKPRVKT
ncbi:MAG: PilN domain-containing protein [Desulfobacterales bacterium]|nr:PilN domain-containing protein [Desulfobacterales bacterium]